MTKFHECRANFRDFLPTTNFWASSIFDSNLTLQDQKLLKINLKKILQLKEFVRRTFLKNLTSSMISSLLTLSDWLHRWTRKYSMSFEELKRSFRPKREMPPMRPLLLGHIWTSWQKCMQNTNLKEITGSPCTLWILGKWKSANYKTVNFKNPCIWI